MDSVKLQNDLNKKVVDLTNFTFNECLNFKNDSWFYERLFKEKLILFSDFVFQKTKLSFDLLTKAFIEKGTINSIIYLLQALYSVEADILITEGQGFIDISINNANEIFTAKRITVGGFTSFNVVDSLGNNLVDSFGNEVVYMVGGEEATRITTLEEVRVSNIFDQVLGANNRAFIESFLPIGRYLRNFTIN